MSGALYEPYTSDASDSGSESDGYTSEESLLNLPGDKTPLSSGNAAKVEITPVLSTATFQDVTLNKATTLFMVNSRDRDMTAYPQPTNFTLRLPRLFKQVKSINIAQINLLNSIFNFSAANGNNYVYVQESGRQPIKVTIPDGYYTSATLTSQVTLALNSTPLFANISFTAFTTGFQLSGDFTPLFNTPGTYTYNSMTQLYDTNITITNLVQRYFQANTTVGKANFTFNECLVAYYYPILKEMIIADPTGASLNLSVASTTSSSGSASCITAPVTTTLGALLVPLPPGAVSWFQYIVSLFEGLDDPYITQLLQDPTRIAIMDAYHDANNFSSTLVNSYQCYYNENTGKVTIYSSSLNASISADLTTKYNQLLSSNAINAGFSGTVDFQTQYASLSRSNASILQFYNYLQTKFVNYFGVDFGKYSAPFYTNLSNHIALWDIKDRYGWNTTLTAAVSASTITGEPVAPISPQLWSNIKVPIGTSPTFVSTLTIPEFGVNQYLNFTNPPAFGNGETTVGYTDVYFTLPATTYAEVRFRSQYRQEISIMTLPRRINDRTSNDLVYALGSNTTPFLFNTLPNSNFYILCDVSGNTLFNLYTTTQIMFEDPDFMRFEDKWLTYVTPQILAGRRIQTNSPNFNKIPPIGDIALTSYRPFIYFQVNGTGYPQIPGAHYTCKLYVETQNGNPFGTEIAIIWYKDRAGFMADIPAELRFEVGKESPRNYFSKILTDPNANSAELLFDINNLQTSYFHINITNPNTFKANIPLRVYAMIATFYGDYRPATRLDYFDLPTNILGSLDTQFSPASAIYEPPNKSIYSSDILQLGYDAEGVSNNLTDYIINSGNGNYFDPENITDYIDNTSTGLEYVFQYATGGAGQPPANTTGWSLYFGAASCNVIYNTYSTNLVVYSATQNQTLAQSFNNNTLTNFWDPTSAIKENYWTPYPGNSYEVINDPNSVFLSAINPVGAALPTDAVTSATYQDTTGTCGLSFALQPGQAVRLDSLLLKFAYTAPTFDNTGLDFGRQYSPLLYNSVSAENFLYTNRKTQIAEDVSQAADWDDWYLRNRRNTKIGIFYTSTISGKPLSGVSLSNALTTMTLKHVTQVNNYQYTTGTLRTREPDWGTFYSYEYDSNSSLIWDVSTITWSPSVAANFVQRQVPGDIFTGPSYSYDYASTVQNSFLTFPTIYNYNGLARSFGLATAIGYAATTPTLMSSFTADVPNTYTIVPFYFDEGTQSYLVGSYFGLDWLNQPAIPNPAQIGEAPYYGSLGPYGWSNSGGNFTLMTKEGFTGPLPYYWQGKLNFQYYGVTYNPATDLEAFGDYPGISGEFQDTMLYVYNSYSTCVKDFVSSSFYVWGNESNANYYAFDDNEGYNFLSYLYNVPVSPLSNPAESYVAHVRAYDPIQSFTTGIRFIGNNYTDFGVPTLYEIAEEISTLQGYEPITDAQGWILEQDVVNNGLVNSPSALYETTIATNNTKRLATGQLFSHAYADALINFDKSIQTDTPYIASNEANGIIFANNFFGFSNFGTAISSFANSYITIQNKLSTFNQVFTQTTAGTTAYIQSRYAGILPSSIATRNRLTDPLTFELLFSTYVYPPLKTQADEWGLGYNLGFNKVDTAPAATLFVSPSFLRIVQSYIYLGLNAEYNVNSLAVSGKEALSETRDTTSQESKYFAKILLSGFGNYSQTAVIQGKTFNPALGKYDKVSCTLYDKNGNPINNMDCDYDFVMILDEYISQPADTNNLVGPTAAMSVVANPRSNPTANLLMAE